MTSSDEGSPRPDGDPRFSLANERTLLAWARTVIGLLAGGVALQVVDLDMNRTLTLAASLLLIVAGIAAAPAAIVHWRATERAIHAGRPAPHDLSAQILTALLAVVGVIVLIAILIP